MAITVRQLREELTFADDDPILDAPVMFEAADGSYHAINEEDIGAWRTGLPDHQSEAPVLLLQDGGEVEIE